MRIIFTDTNTELASAVDVLKDEYGLKDILVFNKPFQEVLSMELVDVLVSPANSFGIMDGGVDLFIKEYLPFGLETRIQEKLKDKGRNFIPVGDCELVFTGQYYPKYLAVAPTMTTPSNISNTINGYLATKAVLDKCKEEDTILFMGMGGLTGGYTSEQCARLMLRAIKDHQDNTTYKSWYELYKLFYECKINF